MKSMSRVLIVSAVLGFSSMAQAICFTTYDGTGYHQKCTNTNGGGTQTGSNNISGPVTNYSGGINQTQSNVTNGQGSFNFSQLDSLFGGGKMNFGPSAAPAPAPVPVQTSMPQMPAFDFSNFASLFHW